MFYNTCSGPVISVVYRFYHKKTIPCICTVAVLLLSLHKN